MKATETSVLSFIGGLDKVFIIPPFQRNYEWGYDECSELFNDIVKAYRSGKTHYLGNVVYYEGENNGASYNEFILVDGQQRVTTILLLLCALRDSLSDTSKVDSVNRRYLLNDTNDNRFRIRLKQTSYDSQSFMSIIDKTPIENNNNVTKNYHCFIDLIKQSGISPIELYESIQRLEIVDVNLKIENNLEAVQTVFEKINSTGKPLSPADLIRNFLLLSNNSIEQERLYSDYWIKIERTIESENVSRFARDFLVMNIFDDVPEKQIYKEFKKYIKEINALHIDVLRNMYKYAKYFAWFLFESCPDEKINNHIKTLNFLKTDDVYPLYLYLFEFLYETNTDELKKILLLISDFMLRYRIVSPSGGGGALRTVVHQLIEGLSSGVIKLTYDDILFELSNSSSPSGRFPNDDEFKDRLMESVNTNYARVLLLKIEEFERKNIPIPLASVTIEHLMPQTLNEWWVNNFGGQSEADRIYDTYLNCIGNLAPISQGYNSKNSNKPWFEKIKQLIDVQFVVTSEIAKITDWKEESIKERNENIAVRACNAVISPIERTRKYITKNSSADFESGNYPVSDLTTPMDGAAPTSIIYDNNIFEISTWKDFLANICKIAYDADSNLFEQVVFKNKIHKATSKKNYPEKDPIISKNKSKLNEANPITNTGYFSEGNISSSRARFYAKQLLDIYELTDRVTVSVRNR